MENNKSIDISEYALELSKKHWSYIESLLKIHGENKFIIDKIKFHYIQSMIHGYKHGLQDK